MFKNYRDFEIRLFPDGHEHFTGFVTRAPAGEGARETFKIPESMAVQLEKGSVRCREVMPEESCEFTMGVDLELDGKALFDALFHGSLGDALRSSIRPGQPLRLRLILEDQPGMSRIHELPWEALFESSHHFLGKSAYFSIVRQFERHQEVSAPTRKRLHVLLLASNPLDLAELDLSGEKASIQRHLRKAGARVTILPVKGEQEVSREDFHRQMKQGVDVIHFMGHGGNCELYFCDEGGRRTPVTASALRDEINILDKEKRPRLLVLNACKSGQVDETSDGFSGVAYTLFKAGAPAVVAMRHPISDDAAIRFSDTFYQCLVEGETLDQAVAAGRLAIDRGKGAIDEWSIPSLFTALEDTRVVSWSLHSFFARNRIALAITTFFLLAAFIWQVFQPKRSTVYFEEVSVLEPHKFVQMDLWQDTSLIKNLLVGAGFYSVGTGLSHLDEDGRARLDPKFTLALRVRRDRQTSLEAVIYNRKMERLPNSIIVHGPIECDSENIADMMHNMAVRLAERLGGHEREIEPVDPRAFRISNTAAELASSDLIEAERKYREALQFAPDFAPAQAGLATLLMRGGKAGEALTHAKRAVELTAGNPAYQYLLGKTYLVLGHQAEARACFTRALELDGGYADAHHELSKLFLEERRWEKARHFLHVGIKLNDSHGPMHKNLGWALLEQKNREKSIQYLERALAIFLEEDEPDTPIQMAQTRFLLSRAHFESGVINEACIYARDLVPSLGGHFQEAAESLISSLPCQTAEEPVGLITFKSGDAFLRNQEGKETKAESGKTLAKNEELHLSKDSVVSILCFESKQISLEGPAIWRHDSDTCEGVERPPWLWSTLFAGAKTIQDHGNKALIPKSRPAGIIGKAILNPRGKIRQAKPTLRWKPTEHAIAYRLRVQGSGEPLRYIKIEREQYRLETRQLGDNEAIFHILDWPNHWFPLNSEIAYQLSVIPEFEEPDKNAQAYKSDFELLSFEERTTLKSRLEESNHFGYSEKMRYRLRAVLLENFGCYAEALNNWHQLAVLSESPPWLELGANYLRLGFPEQAIPLLQNALKHEKSKKKPVENSLVFSLISQAKIQLSE